jgi:hypothetical protein
MPFDDDVTEPEDETPTVPTAWSWHPPQLFECAPLQPRHADPRGAVWAVRVAGGDVGRFCGQQRSQIAWGRERDRPGRQEDMGQTRSEQETIIRWGEADQVVTVYSASPKTWRRCARLGLEVVKTAHLEGRVSTSS